MVDYQWPWEAGDRGIFFQPPVALHDLTEMDLAFIYLIFGCGMTRSAFSVLYCILKSDFFVLAKFRSYNTYSKYSKYLPLKSIFMRMFTSKMKNDDGVEYKKDVWAPYHDVADTIQRELELEEQMVFWAQVGHSFKEFWDGAIFAESPLFTDSEVVGGDQQIYRHGDDVYYWRDGKERAGKLVAIARHEASGEHIVSIIDYVHFCAEGAANGTVAMLWDSRHRVPAQDILRGLLVVTDPGSLVVARRICPDAVVCVGANISTGGRFELVPFSSLQPLMFQLTPSDTLKKLALATSSDPDLEVYRLFLVLFLDDFSTFTTRYHSVGGGYIQFGRLIS